MDSLATLPNALTEIPLQHLGTLAVRWAGSRPTQRPSRSAIRNSSSIFLPRTPTAEGFADAVEWARGVTSALGPDAATYVNFTGEANPALVRASYPPDTCRRLVELKNEDDPTNLFRLNQNIPPSQ